MTDGPESRPHDRRPPGPGVDASGSPVVDPTRNVLDLVAAAVLRLNDLREADAKLHAAELRRVDDLAAQHVRHVTELRLAEAARLDAIRAVDVDAVSRAADVAAAQAATLAQQVATSAEVMRTQVAAVAVAQSAALAAALAPIQETLTDLRRVQYEAQGQKTQVIEQHAVGQYTVALIGLGITLIVAVLGVLAFMATRSPEVITTP